MTGTAIARPRRKPKKLNPEEIAPISTLASIQEKALKATIVPSRLAHRRVILFFRPMRAKILWFAYPRDDVGRRLNVNNVMRSFAGAALSGLVVLSMTGAASAGPMSVSSGSAISAASPAQIEEVRYYRRHVHYYRPRGR